MKDGHKLKIEQVAISRLLTHPRNVRQGDIGAIATSLQAHGQYRPIVAQAKTNHILAGNHTFMAAKHLGWTDIAVTYVDVDDDQALRILLVDNRANDLATYNDQELSDLLATLTATERQLEGTGYTGDDIDQLLADLNDEPKPLNSDPVPFGEKYEVVIECDNEFQQTMLLEKLSLEGLKVRAIVV